MTEAEGERLRRENAELRAQVQKLTEQIAKLADRIGELLAVAPRRQRKPSPEKPVVPPPNVAGDAKRAFDERPKPPAKPERPKREKQTPRPTGRKPLP